MRFALKNSENWWVHDGQEGPFPIQHSDEATCARGSGRFPKYYYRVSPFAWLLLWATNEIHRYACRTVRQYREDADDL